MNSLEHGADGLTRAGELRGRQARGAHGDLCEGVIQRAASWTTATDHLGQEGVSAAEDGHLSFDH